MRDRNKAREIERSIERQKALRIRATNINREMETERGREKQWDRD